MMPGMQQQGPMLEFMLKTQLMDKTDAEVFDVIHDIFAKLGRVLYPFGVEITPVAEGKIIDDGNGGGVAVPYGSNGEYPALSVISDDESDDEAVHFPERKNAFHDAMDETRPVHDDEVIDVTDDVDEFTTDDIPTDDYPVAESPGAITELE